MLELVKMTLNIAADEYLWVLNNKPSDYVSLFSGGKMIHWLIEKKNQ